MLWDSELSITRLLRFARDTLSPFRDRTPLLSFAVLAAGSSGGSWGLRSISVSGGMVLWFCHANQMIETHPKLPLLDGMAWTQHRFSISSVRSQLPSVSTHLVDGHVEKDFVCCRPFACGGGGGGGGGGWRGIGVCHALRIAALYPLCVSFSAFLFFYLFLLSGNLDEKRPPQLSAVILPGIASFHLFSPRWRPASSAQCTW